MSPFSAMHWPINGFLSKSELLSNRAPSPTKKEDDKSKQVVKRKSGASKDGAEKDQGRVKSQTRPGAQSGTSRSDLKI